MLRIFLFAVFSWLAFSDAQAAYTVTNVGTNGNTSGATVTVTSATISSGSIGVVQVTEAANASCNGGASVSDGTNTYSFEDGEPSGGTDFTQCYFSFYYNAGGISSATITYTKQNSGASATISVFSIGGSNGTFDNNTFNEARGTSTSPSVTSGTAPSQSNELFLCFISWSGTATYTQASGWATPPNLATAGSGGTELQVTGGNLVNAGTSSKTCAPTLSASSSWSALIASVNPAAGTVAPQSLLLLGFGN